MGNIDSAQEVGVLEVDSMSSNRIRWIIPNYSSLSTNLGSKFKSPSFKFLDEIWRIIFHPHATDIQDGDLSYPFMAITFVNATGNPVSSQVSFHFQIKKQNGDFMSHRLDRSDFKTPIVWTAFAFLKAEKEIAPNGDLTIHLEVKDESGEKIEIECVEWPANLQQASQVAEDLANLEVGDRQQLTDNLHREEDPTTQGIWQSRISDMYDTKEFCDVQFLLNGRVFKAHRIFLAARSQKFARLLLGSKALDEYIVDEETVTETGFEIMLRFIYKNILGTSDKQSVIEAYRAAHYYGVEDLVNTSTKEIMSWKIPIEEVCGLLNSGLDVPLVKEKCLDLIRKNDQTVLSSSSFLEINTQTLHTILESEVLSNVPAFRLIECVMKWGVHHYGEDYSAIRKKLLESDDQPLLGRLQFQNLNLQDISNIVSIYRGLITPEELMCFLSYHGRNKDASVLPPWCVLEDKKH